MNKRGIFYVLALCVGPAFAQTAVRPSTIAAPTPADTSALLAQSAALTAARKAQAQKIFSSAFTLWQSGDFAAAEIGFKQGLEIDPANGPANYYYGDILHRRNDAAAFTYLARAASLVPDAPEGMKARVLVDQLASIQRAADAQAASAAAARQAIIGRWNFGPAPVEISLKDGVLQATGFSTRGVSYVFQSATLDGDHLQLFYNTSFLFKENKVVYDMRLISPIAMSGTFTMFGSGSDEKPTTWRAFKLDGGYIGAAIQDVTPDIAESLGMGQDKGAMFSAIVPGSPSALAGLMPGDVVIRADDLTISNTNDLLGRVSAGKPDQVIHLQIMRQGVAKTLDVQLGARPAPQASKAAPAAAANANPEKAEDSILGMGLAFLDGPMRSRHAIADTVQGALIVSVAAGSEAALRGLHPWDVIVSANDLQISKPADVNAAIAHSRTAGRAHMLLFVARSGSQIGVPVKIGD